MTPDQLALALASTRAPLVLDVRRGPAFEKNPVLIPGAVRVPPEQITAWAEQQAGAESRALVVYCVHGHEVSQGAAEALRALGFAATHLEGGMSAWQNEGRRTSEALA